MFKKALKSRTVWLGIIVMVLSVLQEYIDFLPVKTEYRILIGIFLGLIIILLRLKTTGSIDEK